MRACSGGSGRGVGLGAWIAVLGVLVGLGAGPARAQGPERVPVNVLVTHLSNDGKGVDPAARRLDRKLRGQFRYDTLQVLSEQRLDLATGEVGSIALPDGREARISPIQVGESGVLMAVDVEGAAKLDARVKNHHLVVIRAGRHEEGDLVLSLEPDLP